MVQRFQVARKCLVYCPTATACLDRLQRGRNRRDMIGADASPEMPMQALQNTLDCEPRPLPLNASWIAERVHVPQSDGICSQFLPIDGESYVREDDGVFCVWQAAVEDGPCAWQFFEH